MNEKEIIESAIYYTKIEYNYLNNLIDRIINLKIRDENTLSHIYDRILSLVFISEEEINILFYKFFNYTEMFNKELSNDYESIFLEYFYNQLNDNSLKKLKKQY